MPTYKVASTSDHHAPITDRKLFEQSMEIIAAFGPDVYVNNGDWFEGRFGARHSKDQRHTWDLETEFREVESQASLINELLPDAKKVFLFGNHDSNLLSYSPDHVADQDVAALIRSRFAKMEETVFKDWHLIKSYRHSDTFYLGGLAFRHGFEVSQSGITKDLADYGYDNCLMCFGHTHRPIPVTQLVTHGVRWPRWYCNTGTLADHEQMYYMDRSRKTQWGAGVLLAETFAQGLNEGKVLRSKPGWSAEMHILSMGSNHFHDVRLQA